MKIISWNVNGIRSCISKGFRDFINEQSPDIVCLQETKAQDQQVDLNMENYYQFWNSAERKGYSGTLILSKEKFSNVTYGIGIEKHDNEGRVITAETETFFLVNVYVPNSGSDRKTPLKRLHYRTIEWDSDFLIYLKTLASKKPIVVCGDFNVAHQEIDLANPTSNRRNAGFTDEERQSFSRLLNSGFVDVFRDKFKDRQIFTWWSYMGRAYENNTGWRIDYFLISKSILPLVKGAEVLISPPLEGHLYVGPRKSDHAPIEMIIDL